MKLTINDVGALGDGIAHHDGDTVFVPYSLPGEDVEADGKLPRLTLQKVISASAHRVDPVCPHFETCGGCAVQHWASEPYLEWKRQKVELALMAEGITTPVESCVAAPIGSRRRVTFTALRGENGVELGFNMRGSNEVVDIQTCSILVPEIVRHLDTFRNLIATVLRGREEIQLSVLSCSHGLDLDFQLPQELSQGMLAAFVHAFAKTPFIRASANGAVLVEREKPMVNFGSAAVPVPPGAFLQAVESIERKMTELVSGHLKKSKKVLDLFCGSGTFALRLAARSRVHAVEMDEQALAALTVGSGAEGLKPVTTEQRDLFEAPLTAKELSRFDGICLDPPRAGALEQVQELAKADIKAVAYVSCNPQTLARDAAVLFTAGFTVDRVVPLDQFVFSPHVEIVALFSKKIARKQRPIFGRKV